jgi:hypothetical protein
MVPAACILAQHPLRMRRGSLEDAGANGTHSMLHMAFALRGMIWHPAQHATDSTTDGEVARRSRIRELGDGVSVVRECDHAAVAHRDDRRGL